MNGSLPAGYHLSPGARCIRLISMIIELMERASKSGRSLAPGKQQQKGRQAEEVMLWKDRKRIR
jgi:hypothetical protein